MGLEEIEKIEGIWAAMGLLPSEELQIQFLEQDQASILPMASVVHPKALFGDDSSFQAAF